MSGNDYSIVQIEVNSLIPYVNNTRTHSNEQVTQIASSIKEFGFNNPILIDETNGIIAGHGRLLGAQKLKMKEVPCIKLAHLTEFQKKAYIIADNKLALNADWDEDLLQMEIEALKDLEFDINLLGFDEKELAKLFGEEIIDLSPIEDIGEIYKVTIDLVNSTEQEALIIKLTDEGYKCKALIL